MDSVAEDLFVTVRHDALILYPYRTIRYLLMPS